jgi:hypothetical protein
MNNNNRNVENTFSYYARIVMLIILSIEFILSIAFLAVGSKIKEILHSDTIDYDYQYKSICATFSLFFISIFVFLVEFLAYCTLNRNGCESEYLRFLCKELNHFISLISFLICQLLYFIDCCLFPVYLQIVQEKEAKKKYSDLVVVAYIFLFIFIILDFIILNLYKRICFKMTNICNRTNECCENFGSFFVDILFCRLCCEKKTQEMINLEEKEEEQIRIISDLTGEIKSLLAENNQLYFKEKKK